MVKTKGNLLLIKKQIHKFNEAQNILLKKAKNYLFYVLSKLYMIKK